MASNGSGIPAAPSIDVWGGVEGGTVHFFVRHPWQWVMKEIASESMIEAVNATDLPSANLPADAPTFTPSTPATRRRREAKKFKGPSTLKLEISDPDTKSVFFAVHGSSSALDGLEDKDELVRTLQRCRCDNLNLSPPARLLSWDVTHDECIKIIGNDWPVLEENTCEKKYAVLKEPMGSQGKGIFFVLTLEEIHKIVDEHRQRAINESGFLDNLISVKGRIPSWVLQAEVHPSLLVANRRKFHIRTYVIIVEKLHDEDLLDIYIFNRHEVRIAGQSVDASVTDRDRLSHITNGALSGTTERVLLDEMEELTSRGIQQKTEIFVASLFATHLLSDIRRRVSVSAQQEPTAASKFAVAGLDLMVTEENRIFLLEVNSNPAAPPLEMVTENFKNHLTGFMHDLVDLVVGQPSPNFRLANEILRENGIAEN